MKRPRGMPIGNLTSQLFANMYLNEFDQFIKHELKVKYYLRYTDDFIVVSGNEQYLRSLIPVIEKFLLERLGLKLHPRKVIICKLHQGIDFLGYIVFAQHRLVRTKTRRRIFAKLRQRLGEFQIGAISEVTLQQSLQSYLGVLSHANTYRLADQLKNYFRRSV